MNRDEARAAFPVLEHFAYLNAGSFGPLARTTVEAMEARLRHDLNHGRGGATFMDELAELRDGVRARLAGLLGAPPENVALTTSTTRSCNIAIAGLRLQPGDEVVTTDNEHFGLLGALHASGATVRVARLSGRPPAEALGAIAAEVGARTRLIALSHVSWMSGHRLPIEELRDQFDLPLLVDGAQSVGAIPVDATRYDFYTVSGQKWLCGPDTTGALYVADPEGLEVAAPSYFAQQEYEPEGSFIAKEGAARFDSDWMALPSVAGLTSAIDTAPEWRYEAGAAAAARCRELLLEAGLEVVTEAGHSTLVSFVPRGDPAETVAAAYEQGVVVRELPKTGWIRASCGYWTNDEDLERLVATVTGRSSRDPSSPGRR
jgi:L-cysteine/cystine lyase